MKELTGYGIRLLRYARNDNNGLGVAWSYPPRLLLRGALATKQSWGVDIRIGSSLPSPEANRSTESPQETFRDMSGPYRPIGRPPYGPGLS